MYHPRRPDDEICGPERSVMAAASQMTGDRDTSQAKQRIGYEQPELTGLASRYMATASGRMRGGREVRLCGRLGERASGRGLPGFLFISAFQGHAAGKEYEKQKDAVPSSADDSFH